MTERIKLDPLINRRVIFKLYDQEPMEATVLSFDDTGYWIRGGTLAHFLSGSKEQVCFLEFRRIQWLQAAPEK